jgi:GWxTD domain-containing protein
MFKKLLLSFVLCVSAVSFLTAQPPARDNIRMFLDFARFRYDENNTYLEIYYLLYDMSRDSLSSSKEVWLEFSLFDENKDSVLAKSNLKVTLEDGNSNNNGARVQGSLIKTVLPSGKYKIKMVRLGDGGLQKTDSLSHIFSAPEFKTDRIAVSDIELCSNIVTGSTNERGLFYKNTMEVFPNPMCMYNEETPTLHYYVELYNVKSSNPRDKLMIEVVVADTEGKIRGQKSYTQRRNYESLVETGSFNVADYPTGLYTIVFAAVDSTEDYSVYTRSNFYVMNISELSADQEDMMVSYSRSEFISMSEEVIAQRIAQSLYIATLDERKIFQNLDNLEGKRMFLFKFWYARESSVNEGLKDEYYSRVEHADEHFGFANRKGWQSDRGRVYIVYGEPSQTDRYPSNPDADPYIVWKYHELEGGASFLFVDESGFGDYKLVSSTMRGEIYDARWDRYLLFE